MCSDFPDINFRVLYIQPDAINDELLSAFKENDNMINYFDIPMQHSNKNILRAMNRSGSFDYYMDLVNKIRSYFDDCTIRTTMIVGFPGETDEQFSELVNFVSEADLDYVGVFEYSAEEETASYNLPNHVSNEVKRQRLNELRDIADKISVSHVDERVGTIQNVVLEGEEDGRFYGRCWFQAPEVDGVVFIDDLNGHDFIQFGETLKVKITDSELYDLVGSAINE